MTDLRDSDYDDSLAEGEPNIYEAKPKKLELINSMD